MQHSNLFSRIALFFLLLFAAQILFAQGSNACGGNIVVSVKSVSNCGNNQSGQVVLSIAHCSGAPSGIWTVTHPQATNSFTYYVGGNCPLPYNCGVNYNTLNIPFPFCAQINNNGNYYNWLSQLSITAPNGTQACIFGMQAFGTDPGANPPSTCAAILPVELTRFSAEPTQSGALLRWETAAEHNSSVFEIWRSGDTDKDWEKVGVVDAKGAGVYTWADNQPSTFANTYYRLRMVDQDGSAEFSDWAVLQNRKQTGLIRVFAQPAENGLLIQAAEAAADTPWKLYNAAGICLMDGNLQEGAQRVALPALAPGIYFFHSQAGVIKVAF